MTLAAVHRRVAVGPDDSLQLKVIYDAEQTSSMPCVVLLSGADCPHESYMWLATRLAEAGCAVTLSSCVVPFGPATCLLSVPFDMAALATLEDYKRGPSSAGIQAVLDELRALTSAADGPLAGRLDLQRLAVGGHSSGGRTALDLAAFDNAFGFGAVFSYGASLVNSGMGSFAPRGSVLACDARAPPPLLLLGGSEDGVSAALSPSGDATETLRRTLSEGVARGCGDADLRIVRGANHMAFCAPVDPCCAAARADRSMADGVDPDAVRSLLGSLILDFLAAHDLVDGPASAGDEAEAEARAARAEMLMLAQEVRGATAKAVPPTTDDLTTDAAGDQGGDASQAVAAEAPADGTTAAAGDQGGDASPAVASEAPADGTGGAVGSREDERAWRALQGALDERLDELRARLRLQPSSFANESSTWHAGQLSGSIEGYESPTAVWAVRYANHAGGARPTDCILIAC